MEQIEKTKKTKKEIIRVENVTKDFILGATTVNVLKGVSASINEGDFAILAGPSGCGKSTLLHIIYGLEGPSTGKIYIDGCSIWEKTKDWRADFRNKFVGFIPQQTFWIKSLSVLENVSIPSLIKGDTFAQSLERAAQLIEMVGMGKWMHNRPYDLSGGQQQRVALARALLLNPRFLIADEPTGNLDMKAGQELMELLKDFNKQFNITILMVTHNPEQYQYADQVIHMLDGLVVDK